MIWKILSVTTSVVLLAVGYFGWHNQKLIKQPKVQLLNERNSLSARELDLRELESDTARVEDVLRDLDDEIEALEVEGVDIKHQIVAAKANHQALTRELAAAKARFEATDIINFAEVEAIQKEIQEVIDRIDLAEIDVVKLEGVRAGFETRFVKLEKSAEELQSLRSNQDAGIISGQFRSSVILSSKGLGFVVIGSGNNQGVVPMAKLDVLKAGRPIARLLVTEVSPELSVAEVVPGTLVSGQQIQIGDLIAQAN